MIFQYREYQNFLSNVFFDIFSTEIYYRSGTQLKIRAVPIFVTRTSAKIFKNWTIDSKFLFFMQDEMLKMLGFSSLIIIIQDDLTHFDSMIAPFRILIDAAPSL